MGLWVESRPKGENEDTLDSAGEETKDGKDGDKGKDDKDGE